MTSRRKPGVHGGNRRRYIKKWIGDRGGELFDRVSIMCVCVIMFVYFYGGPNEPTEI
jgi:hypothetical protein